MFAIASLLALLRQPMELQYEEPWQFYAQAGSLEPAGGYLQVLARLAFIPARLLAEPYLTRIIAALVIGAVAMYLVSDALGRAIPSGPARFALGLSLPLFPVLYWWGPYMGPLNSQWWIALAVVGVALAEPRRWHYPFLLFAGLSGVAPCVALPVFRDRRAVPLAIAAGIQGVVWLLGRSKAQPLALEIAPEYLWLMAALLVALIASRLPTRTQFAFAYLALAQVAMGGVLHGMTVGNDRYLTGAWAALALGASATLLRKVGRIDVPVGQAPGGRRGRASVGVEPDERPRLPGDALERPHSARGGASRYRPRSTTQRS